MTTDGKIPEDRDATLEADLEELMIAATSATQSSLPLSMTFGELMAMNLAPRKEVICGLGRGENGILNAPTDIGKSTLLRNLVLSIAAGRPFPPFTPGGEAERVVLFDSEDTLVFLRSDIAKMVEIFTPEEQVLVASNLLIFCEASVADNPIQLNRDDHFDRVAADITAFKPDLVCIDTISRSFSIKEENDNREVIDSIIKPLKRLAVMADTAVLAAHHIGKSKAEDGGTRMLAHKGRGASSFADQSRVIFNLEKEAKTDHVILSCAKLKGTKFVNQVLELDAEQRWFGVRGTSKVATNYELVIELCSDGQPHKTGDIVTQLKDRMCVRSVKAELAKASDRGDLVKVGRGIYQARAELIRAVDK